MKTSNLKTSPVKKVWETPKLIEIKKGDQSMQSPIFGNKQERHSKNTLYGVINTFFGDRNIIQKL